MREALRLVAEEGIEERWRRHRRVAGALKAGVRAMGLEMNADDEYWLPSLNAVRVPAGIDAGEIIQAVLDGYDIEIAGGPGDLAGEIFRIGCMGHSARAGNVLRTLAALGGELEREGASVDPGAGLDAARTSLEA
jgi:alanine-glyoxylate transaminase/serine-glyoxylate transaminase/serine-pyruvate transaminase